MIADATPLVARAAPRYAAPMGSSRVGGVVTVVKAGPKFEKLADGKASFTITPSNFLIRMAVAPLQVTFDAGTKTPVRYEGRVPPMENISGKLKDLDARVEYTSVSAVYR